MAGFMWLGHGGATHKTVCWHADAPGKTITVACNGVTWSAAAVTDAAKANNVAITINGLSPNTEYPYSIYEDNVLVYASNGSRSSGADYPHLRTHPTIGSRLKIAWASCIQAQVASPIMQMILEDVDIFTLYILGDTPYADDPGTTYWGVTWTTITTDPSFANWSKVFEAWHRNPANQRCLRAVECLRSWNDHEIMDNGSPDQAFFVNNLATARSVMAAWCVGNPANDDAGIDSGALYFRNTVGPIEHFVIDTQSYKSAISATDDASKTLQGSNQKAWLKSRLLSSTAGFKSIALGYRLGSALTDHVDGSTYQTEEAEIHTHINGNGIACTYFLEGDFHACSMTTSVSPWKLGVNPCPGGVSVFHAMGAGYSGDVAAKLTDYAGTAPAKHHFAYGIEDVAPDWQSVELQIQLASSRPNSPWWRGIVDAGINALRYESLSIG